MSLIEDLIAEEFKRFNNINTYVQNLNEQFIGLAGNTHAFDLGEQAETPPEEDEGIDPLAGGEEAIDPLAGGEEGSETLAAGEEGIDPLGDTAEGDVDPLAGGEDGGETLTPPVEDVSGKEELDVTDIVTMTKETGEKAENLEKSVNTQQSSVEALISKLDDLETKLGDMDKIVASIDELEGKFEKYRPQTPVEKLELRYLDSGPFNQKPSDYWEEKTGELEKQKDKHEYVLTQGEVENYNDSDIKQSWTYDEDNDEDSV